MGRAAGGRRSRPTPTSSPPTSADDRFGVQNGAIDHFLDAEIGFCLTSWPPAPKTLTPPDRKDPREPTDRRHKDSSRKVEGTGPAKPWQPSPETVPIPARRKRER